MQLQHHIHECLWPRCNAVEVQGEWIYCELAVDRQYDLVKAYPKTPHVQFMNCEAIDDLRAFTLAWGPLFLVREHGIDEISRAKAIRRLDELRAHRRWLRAIKGLLEACRGRVDERSALVEFLAADSDLERTSSATSSGQIPLFQTVLQQSFGYAGDSITWADSADTASVKIALALCVEAHVSAPTGCVRVEKRRGRMEVNAGFSLPTLWEALLWMVWLDEWKGWPPSVCIECHKIFPQLTAHERKYCCQSCAHRATNRAWRRRDLRKRRKKARRREMSSG